MEIRQKYVLIIGGVIITVIAVASLAYQNLALFGRGRGETLTEKGLASQEVSSSVEGGTSKSDKGYTTEVIPPEELPPYRGVPIGVINESEESRQNNTTAMREKLTKQLAGVAASLTANPDNFDAWIEVGSVKHYFGDEIGARDAWEYAGVIRPENMTSFFNLGNLYGYYLKDTMKAEKNFRMVLQNDPNYIPGYFTLVAFYRDVYKEKYPIEAEKILLAGEKALSLDLNLIQSLAFLYKDMGNTAKAIEYFEKFLSIDPKNDAIRTELEALRR